MNIDCEPKLALIPSLIKECFGEPPLESFECEFFLEDIERYIFFQNLEKIKKASDVALVTQGLTVSSFIHIDESTYRWKFLQ